MVSCHGMYHGACIMEPILWVFPWHFTWYGPWYEPWVRIAHGSTFFLRFTHARNVHAAMVQNHGIRHVISMMHVVPCAMPRGSRTCRGMVRGTVPAPMVDAMSDIMACTMGLGHRGPWVGPWAGKLS